MANQKTVLMVQPQSRQGEVWQAALQSQDIAVIWERGEIDLPQTFDDLQAANLDLPDLLLLEIRQEGFNPYAFCRWCRDHHPRLKIVLTSNTQKEVSAAERRWAIQQGAEDFLPAFQSESLLTGVILAMTRVTNLLDLGSPRQEKLAQALVALVRRDTTPVPVGAEEPVSEMTEPTTSSTPTTSSSLRYYRGVPVGQAREDAPAAPPPEPKPKQPPRQYRGIPLPPPPKT